MHGLQLEQNTKDNVGEAIILEQLLHVLPQEVRTWGKEHEPAGLLAAANWLFSTSMCRENDQLKVPPVLHIDWL